MAYLLDTNVLLRVAQPSHPSHLEARKCVRLLLRRKESVHIVPQILFEFWVVASRPVASNGLGLPLDDVKRKITKAESLFSLNLDTPGIYKEWLRLVETYSVFGAVAHDARLVAAMKVHRLSHIITFNLADFKRYNGPEITVVSPVEILSTLASSS